MEHLPIPLEKILLKNSPEKELTPAQKLFANALMRIAGVTTLEDLQMTPWKFESSYDTSDRDAETTNYRIDSEGNTEADTTSRRCTVCHQPLEHVNLISINGQTVQMGSDCTAKLARFAETGEIVAENPIRKMHHEQKEILLEGANYEREILKQMKARGEDVGRITKSRIVASMMTWLYAHNTDASVPETIRKAVHMYHDIGVAPSTEDARNVSNYYKATRKFLPAEILDSVMFAGFKEHPHRGLLKNIASEGVLQKDLERLKQIIIKGHRIHNTRNWQKWEEERVLKIERETEKARKIQLNRRRKEYAQLAGSRNPEHLLREEGALDILAESAIVEKKVLIEPIKLATSVRLRQSIRGGKYILEPVISKPSLGIFQDRTNTHEWISPVQPVLEGPHTYLYLLGAPYEISSQSYSQASIVSVNNALSRGTLDGSDTEEVMKMASRNKTIYPILMQEAAQVVLNESGVPVILLDDEIIPFEQFLDEYTYTVSEESTEPRSEE